MYALGPSLLGSPSIPLCVQPSHRGFEFKLGGVQILLIGFWGAAAFDKTGNTGNIKGNTWKGGAWVSMYVPLVCRKCRLSAANRTYRTNQCDGKSIYSWILLVCFICLGWCWVSYCVWWKLHTALSYGNAAAVFSSMVLYHHFPLMLSI